MKDGPLLFSSIIHPAPAGTPQARVFIAQVRPQVSSKRLEGAVVRIAVPVYGYGHAHGSPSSFSSILTRFRDISTTVAMFGGPFFGAGNRHTCAFRKPGTWMSLFGLTVLAPALSPSTPAALPATRRQPHPPFLNHEQVWSYCIISLSLLHHPPVLHDGYLVRPVHQILLTRPSLLKNDPFPLTFSLKSSPYHRPPLSKASPSSPPIGASCYPGSVVTPTILKARRVYYSYVPHGSHASPLLLVFHQSLERKRREASCTVSQPCC